MSYSQFRLSDTKIILNAIIKTPVPTQPLWKILRYKQSTSSLSKQKFMEIFPNYPWKQIRDFYFTQSQFQGKQHDGDDSLVCLSKEGS